MQQMMNVDEPDYGHLLADMRVAEDVSADAGRYCYPRVEIETAFILGADLPGEDCSEADVLAATEALAPAIELIDSRILDWKIGLADTIADNASSAGFVIGQARVAWLTSTSAASRRRSGGTAPSSPRDAPTPFSAAANKSGHERRVACLVGRINGLVGARLVGAAASAGQIRPIGRAKIRVAGRDWMGVSRARPQVSPRMTIAAAALPAWFARRPHLPVGPGQGRAAPRWR